MSEFQREERYIVIKRKHLDESAESALRGVIAGLDLETVECVVVEWDQPHYEATWQSARQVAEGAYDPDEITTLRQKLEQAEARCVMQTDALQDIAVALKDADNLSRDMHDLIASVTDSNADRWLLRKQAEAVEAIKPTAEMKAEMLGSFKFTEEMTCSACYFDEPDNDCEVCAGDVTYAQDFQIPWYSQKQIIGTAVAHVGQRLRQQADELEKESGQ